jgi:hypothetical protein
MRQRRPRRGDSTGRRREHEGAVPRTDYAGDTPEAEERGEVHIGTDAHDVRAPERRQPMPQLCVSGPVIRHSAEWDVEPWVQHLYELVERASPKGSKVLLPRAEPDLERKQPLEFFHVMRRRLGVASAVVAVFTPGDVSVAIETTMAAIEGKKIVVIAENPEEIPRLLRGLPGVVETMRPEEFKETLSATMAKLGWPPQ